MMERRGLTCDEIRSLAPLFVIGALDPAEMASVRRHLADCADLHDEVLVHGEAATALLETVPPSDPPARLKTNLLAAAAADLQDGRHPSVANLDEPAPEGRPVRLGAVRRDGGAVRRGDEVAARRRPSLGWLVAAAAVVVALALGGSNLALRRDVSVAETYRDGIMAALELVAQPGATGAILESTQDGVTGLGAVGADGAVLLAVQGLAPTTGTEVYTAWVIPGPDGAPVPIGDFTVGAGGVAVARAHVGGQTVAALAITLEPAPGATTPTLPIVASGEASTLGGAPDGGGSPSG